MGSRSDNSFEADNFCASYDSAIRYTSFKKEYIITQLNKDHRCLSHEIAVPSARSCNVELGHKDIWPCEAANPALIRWIADLPREIFCDNVEDPELRPKYRRARSREQKTVVERRKGR